MQRVIRSSINKPAEVDEVIFNEENRNIISEEKAIKQSPDYKKLAKEFKEENVASTEKMRNLSDTKLKVESNNATKHVQSDLAVLGIPIQSTFEEK